MTGKSVPVTTAISAAFGQLQCDRDMAALLDFHETLRPVRFTPRTDVDAARRGPALADALRRIGDPAAADAQAPARVDVRDLRIDGAAGTLPARVYVPNSHSSDTPLPLVLYFHGGGWVLGGIDKDDASCRAIATQAGAIVVSAGYRLAPEHRFPAAWEDALAAWLWVREHAASLQADRARIALAGEGAGANLALATAMTAHEQGLPVPAHVLAICPVAQTGTNTVSYLENAVARPLGRAAMAWCFDRLVRQPADLKDPRLHLCGADLAGLPPVTLISARLDPLRTDAQRLHDALVRALVPVAWQEYQGVTHGFFGAGDLVDKARQAQQFAGQCLAQALARPEAVARVSLLRQFAARLGRLAGGLRPPARQVPERASA